MSHLSDDDLEARATAARAEWVEGGRMTTTPPLLATRDAMAEVLCPPHHREGFCGILTSADGTSRSLFSKRRPCLLHTSQADALLASGVVRDPATLADDETLDERVAQESGVTRWSVHDVLRALAVALSEDAS